MSTTETIMRYHLIISKIKRKSVSLTEMNKYLEKEGEFSGYNFIRDKRTFHRDLNAIRSIYDIDIQYNFKTKVYEIVQDEQSHKNLRMAEALDLFNSLKLIQNNSANIYFEKRRPVGTENLRVLLHAIRNRFQVQFIYLKYWEDSTELRYTEPVALKEFKSRWYLIGRELQKNEIRIFALDRISCLFVTNIRIQNNNNIDVKGFFQNCFGIIVPHEPKIEEVILSFDAFQGKYIKSLPIHDTQEILIDNLNEVQVKLNIYLTEDFIMEILSFGNRVKVIKPKHLIVKLIKTYKKTLEQYSIDE